MPADLSSPKDIAKIVDTLQNFVKRGIPVRFGVAPLISTVSAKNQARVVYYLLDTYGLGAVMNYLELVGDSSVSDRFQSNVNRIC